MHTLQSQGKRGHLVEEADIQRLLCVESHIKVNLVPSALAARGALICCQRDEAPGPVPLSNTEALIHKTFHVFFSASSPDQTTKVTRFPLKSRLVNTSWASPLVLVFIVFQFKKSWFWCILPLRATSYFEVYFFFHFRLEKTQVLMRRMPRTQQPLSLLLVFP